MWALQGMDFSPCKMLAHFFMEFLIRGLGGVLFDDSGTAACSWFGVAVSELAFSKMGLKLKQSLIHKLEMAAASSVALEAWCILQPACLFMAQWLCQILFDPRFWFRLLISCKVSAGKLKTMLWSGSLEFLRKQTLLPFFPDFRRYIFCVMTFFAMVLKIFLDQCYVTLMLECHRVKRDVSRWHPQCKKKGTILIVVASTISDGEARLWSNCQLKLIAVKIAGHNSISSWSMMTQRVEGWARVWLLCWKAPTLNHPAFQTTMRGPL